MNHHNLTKPFITTNPSLIFLIFTHVDLVVNHPQVIRRMIKHDNTLLVVEQSKALPLPRNADADTPGQEQEQEQEVKNEDKWLKLNPNHDM